MSQNLTQPEEIDLVMQEMTKSAMQAWPQGTEIMHSMSPLKKEDETPSILSCAQFMGNLIASWSVTLFRHVVKILDERGLRVSYKLASSLTIDITGAAGSIPSRHGIWPG
jgi:hypothetical protein